MADMPRTTQALLKLLPSRSGGSALDVGSFQGAVATAAGCPFLSADLLACKAARQAGVLSIIHSDMLPEGPFDLVCFDARDYDPAMAAEMVAQAARSLVSGGTLLTTARPAEVRGCFAEVDQQGEVVVGRSPLASPPDPPWPVYTAVFDGNTYQVASAPGIFSPHRLDAGTAHMLAGIPVPTPGTRFLDLGCGAGVVSLIATEAWACQVTAVDVNARALRLAALNAPKAEVLASDGFRHLEARTFDIVACNPPYHTDFAVAKRFIEGAHQHLSLGGTLYLVVKRADWYAEKTRQVFGGCRVAEAGEYVIISAEKRVPRPRTARPEPEAPTTRKHLRRMSRRK